MRKGMNSLCSVVQNLMGYDVRMGDDREGYNFTCNGKPDRIYVKRR